MTPRPMRLGSSLMRDDLAHVRSYIPRYDANAGAARLASALAKTGAITAATGTAVAAAKTSAAGPLRLAVVRWLSFLLGPSLLVTGGALTVRGIDAELAVARAPSGSALLAPEPGLRLLRYRPAGPRRPEPAEASGLASSPPAPAPPPLARTGRGELRSRSIAAELREVAGLNALLHRDPDAALKQLDRTPADRRRVLSEEREIIAIEALVATKRRAEARRRAGAFVASHPESAYAARARTIASEPSARSSTE